MLYLLNVKKYENKNVSELWNSRKSFYLWIIGLFVGLLVLLAFGLISLITHIVDKDVIIKSIMGSNNNVYDGAYNGWVTYIINDVVNTSIVLAATISFIMSVIKSFKLKTFASISYLPTLLIFINMLYSFFGLFQLMVFKTRIIEYLSFSIANVIAFSSNFVYLLIWFLFSRNVSLLRRIFIKAQLVEAMNIYNNKPGMSANNIVINEDEINVVDNNLENTDLYKKLSTLNKEKLNLVAEKLSISGYESLSKDELIKIICKIDQSNKEQETKKTTETKDNNNKSDDNNEKI